MCIRDRLRTASKGISLQGPGAGGVAGMKLKPGSRVLAAGPVDFGTFVVLVSDEGAVKVTDAAEVPTKGRATGGVRTVRWRDFETTATFAWVGRGQQLAAVARVAGDDKKLEPVPEPLSLDPTKRDSQTVALDYRVALVGEYRF